MSRVVHEDLRAANASEFDEFDVIACDLLDELATALAMAEATPLDTSEVLREVLGG